MAETASDIYLSSLSQRDKPWDTHKGTADTVAQLYREAGDDGRYARMRECSQQLHFALVPQDDGEIRFRIKHARFCRQRHCPICQWRRAMMWRSRILRALHPDYDRGDRGTRKRYILQDFPKHRFIFATFTVKNCDLSDLRSTCKAMSDAWHRMIKRSVFPADGWVRSLEVTRNAETGQAHPHYHCLLMVPASYFGNQYLSHKKWQSLWRESMRLDYDPVVNIKAVKGKDGTSLGVTSGIVETLKYEIKPQDLIADSEWLVQLTTQLSKMRSVALGGIFKEYIKESEPENLVRVDDDDEGEDLSAYPEWHFVWREAIRHYVKSKEIDSPTPQDDCGIIE